jgi:hypothetical protein
MQSLTGKSRASSYHPCWPGPKLLSLRAQKSENAALGQKMPFVDGYSVRPQMVDFGSEQGLSTFETAGIVSYVEDFKRAKTQPWAKRCRLWMDTT